MNIKCITALALLLPAVVFAQGKPSQPGPPSTQPQLQYLVDATGKVVGETSGGITSALIKYTLSTGDFVFLSATPQELSSLWVVPLGNSPTNARVYFREADCSGDAYLTLGLTPAMQFTRHQAMILQLFLTPPSPPSCPFGPVSSDWLYVSDSLVCPYFALVPGNAITFLAYYGLGVNPVPGCAPIPGGLTVPGAPFVAPNFTIYKRVEDLAAKYKTPFSIQ